MALGVAATGTQTATVGTEHSLATITTGKTLVLVVDAANMALGDVLRLRIYVKAVSGGTERLAYDAWFAHAQADPVKISLPVPAHAHFRATLTQTAGTGRSYDWTVLSLD